MVTCALKGCNVRWKKADKRSNQKYCCFKHKCRANSIKQNEVIKNLRKTDPEFREKQRVYQNQYMKKYLQIPENYEKHKEYMRRYQRRIRAERKGEKNE